MSCLLIMLLFYVLVYLLTEKEEMQGACLNDALYCVLNQACDLFLVFFVWDQVLDDHTYCMCVLGIHTDESAVFANSWAVDLPHERACPSVDLDFNGPCQSESDMDVRTNTHSFYYYYRHIL